MCLFSFQYYPFIEIAIKQCKSSGIDCKVHGLSMRGRLRSDEDEGSAATCAFLASDNEEDPTEEPRTNVPQVTAAKHRLKHTGMNGTVKSVFNLGVRGKARPKLVAFSHLHQ